MILRTLIVILWNVPIWKGKVYESSERFRKSKLQQSLMQMHYPEQLPHHLTACHPKHKMDAKCNTHTPSKTVWSLNRALHMERTPNILGLCRALSVTKHYKMWYRISGNNLFPRYPYPEIDRPAFGKCLNKHSQYFQNSIFLALIIEPRIFIDVYTVQI